MPQFDPDEYLSEVTDAANSAIVGFDFNAPLSGMPVYQPRPAIRAAQARNPMRQIPRGRILELPLPQKAEAPQAADDFDPDAYLSEIAPPRARVLTPAPADDFDPDSYLAEIAGPQPAQPTAPAWQPMADTQRAQLGTMQAEAGLSADATRQAANDLAALYQPQLDAAKKAARREGYTVPELSPAYEALKAQLKAQQASIGAEASGFDAVKRDLIAQERAGITPPVEQKPEFPDFMTWRQQEIDAGRMDPGASMVPDWIDAMIPQAAGALAQQAGGVLRAVAPSSRTLGDIGTALSDAGAAAKGMAAQVPGASGSIGRGAGNFIGLATGTPTLRALAPATLTTAARLGNANAVRAIQSTATIPMAQRAAQEAAESVRAAGGDKAAQDAAAQHALVMLPVYMAGGAAAARAGSRLAGPAAGPAMQTAVGTAASIAGNVGTSAALAAIEGGDYGLENLTVDSLFGILHGVGVWKGAKAQTRADAADILISRGVDPFAAAIDRIPRNTRAPKQNPPAAVPTKAEPIQQALAERNRLLLQELPKHNSGTNGYARIKAEIARLDSEIEALQNEINAAFVYDGNGGVKWAPKAKPAEPPAAEPAPDDGFDPVDMAPEAKQVHEDAIRQARESADPSLITPPMDPAQADAEAAALESAMQRLAEPVQMGDTAGDAPLPEQKIASNPAPALAGDAGPARALSGEGERPATGEAQQGRAADIQQPAGAEPAQYGAQIEPMQPARKAGAGVSPADQAAAKARIEAEGWRVELEPVDDARQRVAIDRQSNRKPNAKPLKNPAAGWEARRRVTVFDAAGNKVAEFQGIGKETALWEAKTRIALDAGIEPPPPPKFRNPMQNLPPAPGGGEDVISYLWGTKIRSPKWYKDQGLPVPPEYDLIHSIPLPWRTLLFAKDGEKLDDRAHEIRNTRGIGNGDEFGQFEHIETGGDMIAEILAAIKGREKTRDAEKAQIEEQKEPTRQANAFERDRVKPVKAAEKLTGDDLRVGDVLTLRGKELRVIELDPDTGTVTLDDGQKYGQQMLGENEVIYARVKRRGNTAPETTADGGDSPFSRRGTPKIRGGQRQGDLLDDGDAFNLAGERAVDPWRLQAERDAAERRAEEARLDAERRQRTMDLGEPAAPRPASVQIPRRSELQKPITGPSGARIVGYEWRSQVDTVWSDARQEYVARRVSDWDAADKSQGTGRDIVHVFYVEKPDGSISTEGIKSAQNILGISETKLQTIAKNERQARLNQKQRDDDFAASIEKAAPLSADEADRRYRDANNPERMMWGTRAQHEAAAAEAFRKSVLLTKDGRFTRTGAADVIELLKERGWNEPPAVVQDSLTTAEQSSAVPQPPRIQPGRTQGDLGLEGRPTGAPKLQPGQRQGAFEFSRRGQSRAIETPENNPETFWKRVWNTVAPGPARDIALELRDPAELVRAGFKTPEQLDGSETAVYLSRQKAIWLLDEGISGRLATHTLLDVNHEAAHAWQEGYSPQVWAALERLWKAEVTNGEGPLFDEAGELWGNVNPDVFRSVKEWAAERAAHENLKWSEARAKAAEHDGSLIGKLAAGLRSTWAKVRLATTGERPDVITQGLREFLQRGDVAARDGAQFSRRNERRTEDAKRDRDYLDAVKRGDTAQAQRLVDEAAKAAGYTIGPVGHGTGERFNTFRHEFGGTSTEAKSAKEAFFFSDGERTPKSYAVYAAEQGPIKALMRQAEQAEKRGDWDAYERLIAQAEDMTYGEAGAESTMKRRENARVLRVYLKGRFMELDAEGKSPQELGDTNQFSEFDGSITAAIKSAKRKGYDGLIIRNLDDAAGVTEVSNHFAVFDSNQIKLADPVTYDDAGQPIPLLKRFQSESDDIRFSTRGDKAKAEREQRILDAMKGKPGAPMPAPNAGRGDPFESVVPDAALPRASRVWRGVADVFDEVKGLGFLADAIRKHVDRQRMLQGKVTAPFRQWEQRHGRAERRKAEQEFEAYQRKLDQERDPDLVRDLNRGKIRQTGADTGGMSSDEYRRQASPAGRELIEAWDGIASRVQKRNQALNVMARGADGHWKPIGTVTQYYPRSLRPDILRALRNPKGNRKAYAELARELYDAGLIKDAREAQQFIQTHFRTESQFDHLGNIEAARAVKMPTKLYDYTFAAARRYLMGWTERIAQIEAFGQKTTKTSKDVFDVAMDRMIGNEPVQEYIDAARKLAYSERSQTVWAKALRLMNTAAAGLQLGNPITVGVNLASGLAYNASHFGYANAMRGFWELRKLGQQINEAHEAGVLLDDLMGIAEDARGSGSKAEEAAAAMTRGLLSVSGYNASETFVRAHGYATARAFLRQYLKDTGNGQFRRFFERNKLNADKLAAENGTGPETDKFLRRTINDAQGGYRYDQVPVFTDTPIGRFLFKYQKWGTQALRNFMINTSPLVGRAKDPAAWASAARYLLTTALVGWGIEGAKTALFGVSPRTAGLVEIAKTADEDEKRAWALATQKAWRSMMAAGAFGILGNYVQIATDVAERSRFKNPLDPPGLAAAKGAGELLMTAYEQGKLTSGDALDFLGKQVSLARVLKAGVARAVEAAGGTDNAPRMIQDETTRQNLSWSAGIVRRFLDEQGVEATRTQLGRVASSPLLPYKRAVVQAIHRGDLPGGREAIADYLSRLAPQDRKAAQRALESYVATKQPLKVDGSTSAMREAFIRWAQRRLDTRDFLRLMRMDQGYRTTAKQLGLMDTPKKPTEADLEKALQRRKMPR